MVSNTIPISDEVSVLMQWVSQVEQELLALPERLFLPPLLVLLDLTFSVMLCILLLVFLFFSCIICPSLIYDFSLPLYCLQILCMGNISEKERPIKDRLFY